MYSNGINYFFPKALNRRIAENGNANIMAMVQLLFTLADSMGEEESPPKSAGKTIHMHVTTTTTTTTTCSLPPESCEFLEREPICVEWVFMFLLLFRFFFRRCLLSCPRTSVLRTHKTDFPVLYSLASLLKLKRTWAGMGALFRRFIRYGSIRKKR